LRRYNLELDDDLLDDEQDNELHATPRRESRGAASDAADRHEVGRCSYQTHVESACSQALETNVG